jgi:hypothetical protein
LLRLRPRDVRVAFRGVTEAPAAAARTPGSRFAKLMGTGRGRGFSVCPDLSRYLLLAAFDRPGAARAFEERAPWLAECRARALERYELTLEPVHSHGRWDGTEPFGAFPKNAPPIEGPLLVITRARLRAAALPAFWRLVPSVDAALARSEAAASGGFGEVPWVRQATFSLWPDAAAMGRFVHGAAHREVMHRARRDGWFAEELFARFRPLRSEGTWHGRDPLEELRR